MGANLRMVVFFREIVEMKLISGWRSPVKKLPLIVNIMGEDRDSVDVMCARTF